MNPSPIQLNLVPLDHPRAGLRIEARDAQGRQGVGEGFPLPERSYEDLHAAAGSLAALAAEGWRELGHVASDAFELARQVHTLELSFAPEDTRQATPVTKDSALELSATDAFAALRSPSGSAPSEGPLYALAPVACFTLESALFAIAAEQQQCSRASLIKRALQEQPGASTATQQDACAEPKLNALLPETLCGAALIAAAKEALAKGYQVLKFKAGRRPFEEERTDLFALREALGEHTDLRIDVNGRWSLAEAQERLQALLPLNLEFVEQPVDTLALAELTGSPIPLAADESVASAKTRARLYQTRAAQIFVLKPGVLGGLMQTAKIAAEARAQGLALVLTHAADGPIARTAAHDLARALMPLRYACGLAP